MVEDLEEKDFPEYRMYIGPLFNNICKIWAHSKFYCVPTRLIVLLQEICNLFISQVKYVCSKHGLLITCNQNLLAEAVRVVSDNFLKTCSLLLASLQVLLRVKIFRTYISRLKRYWRYDKLVMNDQAHPSCYLAVSRFPQP